LRDRAADRTITGAWPTCSPVSSSRASGPPDVRLVPAAFFGIVLGLAGLGGTWRVAARVWALPALVGEILMLLAAVVWVVLVVAYVVKWVVASEAAHDELHHPVQCCFVGVIGVAGMLVAGAALPYSRIAAEILFGVNAAYTLAFAVWRTGGLWHGERDVAATTPVLYLPTVAGSFVTAILAGALGFPAWGRLAFGAGALSWLAIESVLIHRLLTAPALAVPLRPTLGIQLAPPTVGALAYLSVTSSPPDTLAYALIGYGLLQALVLLRLLAWIRAQPFAPSYWAFTFGATALATAPLRLIERGDTGPIAVLAPYLFVAANLVVGAIALGTVRLIVRGRLLPRPAPPAAAVPPRAGA
jgi:tellurite resistance protein